MHLGDAEAGRGGGRAGGGLHAREADATYTARAAALAALAKYGAAAALPTLKAASPTRTGR